MKRTSFRTAAIPTVAALALGLSLSACGASNEKSSDSSNAAASSGASLSGTLNGAGSSAQEAAQGAWTAGFQSANSGVTVNYDPSGSGAGVEQFLAGAVNYAGSDASLADDQLASSKKVCNGATALEVPDYISPIALVYNLDGVSKLQLSPDTAAKIFAAKITTWDDAAIKADNPGVTLPSTKITAVHRSDDSGTTKNFTDYLHQTAASTWTTDAAETWPFKSGEGANGTSGVIQSVTSGKGAIGYADASQAGKLGVASIKVGSSYVAPTADAAAKAADVSKRVTGRAANDMALTVDRTTTEAGAYPLVLVSYFIACPTYKDAKTADVVKGYATYVVSSEGQAAAAKAAGSAPLSSTLSGDATTAVKAIAAK
ncbi:MAG: phosphate ABC transporter substrate-binding protein PstS [Nocardioidaceae bacterium]